MKYTKEQIIKKSELVLKDLEGEYYRENLIEEVIFKENDKISMGPYEGEVKPVWIVFVKSLFEHSDHLYLSDEDGEPIYLQNFNYISMEIAKNNEGKYYRKM